MEVVGHGQAHSQAGDGREERSAQVQADRHPRSVPGRGEADRLLDCGQVVAAAAGFADEGE
ncbi:hypothetical protein ADK93_02265 [Streptomyces sp. XY58]|nr:hypothetical protein ADK93_02265 [Streptomyces sp. XY58]KOU99961.1 hypothetical protein ADK89_34660 [Streptomyces sp. XY37]KOV39912.1 hypothetical protein ADK99_36020 [Streptomyces sp. MMG1064]